MIPSRIGSDIQSRWNWEVPPTEEEVNAAIRALTFKYANQPDTLLRWMDVIDRVHEGQSFRDIANAYGTSRARASQLYWNTLVRIRDIIVFTRSSQGDLMTALEVLRNAT